MPEFGRGFIHDAMGNELYAVTAPIPRTLTLGDATIANINIGDMFRYLRRWGKKY
ncbi:MAG: hypothetical protein NVS4B11_31100 [Ktedonobacteraceae bacterium]